MSSTKETQSPQIHSLEVLTKWYYWYCYHIYSENHCYIISFLWDFIWKIKLYCIPVAYIYIGNFETTFVTNFGLEYWTQPFSWYFNMLIDCNLTINVHHFCLQTAFLQGLLNRNLRYVATLNRQHLSNFTINTVQVYGQDKYLMVSDSLLSKVKDNFLSSFWIRHIYGILLLLI